MPLPNVEPSEGPSFTLCVGETWRPPIAGLLQEMCDSEYWEQYSELEGVALTTEDIEDYKNAACRIVARIAFEGVADGCPDLAGPTVPSTYGTQYTKQYSFAGSNVPAGWTITRGAPESTGLRTVDSSTSQGWIRTINARLDLVVPAYAVFYIHTAYMNCSPFANAPIFIGGFFLSSAARLSGQCEPLPEVGTWNMQLNNLLQIATSNQVQVNIRIDSGRNAQNDLLGDAWLQNVDLMAFSPNGNPFP